MKCSCYSMSQFSRFAESPTHSLSQVKTDAVSAHESGLTDLFSRQEGNSLLATAGVNRIRIPHGSRVCVSPVFPPVVYTGFGFAPLFVPLLASGQAVAPAAVELFALQAMPMATEIQEGGRGRNHSNRFLFNCFNSE